MRKTEPEIWKQGTDLPLAEEKGRQGEWWKAGEGTSQRIWMNDHGHGHWGGDGLWEQGMAWDGGGQRGKNWDNCNRINKNQI